MSEKNEEKTDLVTLIDEEGNEHDFAVVDLLNINDKQYAILVPVACGEEDEEDGDDVQLEEDAYIFRVDKVDGEETLVEVEEDEEWERVATEWENRMQAMGDDEEDVLL